MTFAIRPSVLAALLAALGAGRPCFGGEDGKAPRDARHTGACDASAAVDVGKDLFVVANDDDDVLRVYRRGGADGGDHGNGPVATFDLEPDLKQKKPKQEVDIEGATRVGDRVYWIGSHGRNADGEVREPRRTLFATRVTVDGDRVAIEFDGGPYEHLLRDLLAAPAMKPFALEKAEELPPEAEGGLNVEGLAATPDGAALWVGFRNPIRDGGALLVPLTNPADLLGGGGGPATFGKPAVLDLGGRGVRSIEYHPASSQYLIVAGPHGDIGTFALYRWSGNDGARAEPLDHVKLGDLKPEGLVTRAAPDPGDVLLISDDGGQIDGMDCSDKAVPERDRSFRSRVIARADLDGPTELDSAAPRE